MAMLMLMLLLLLLLQFWCQVRTVPQCVTVLVLAYVRVLWQQVLTALWLRFRP